MVVKKLLVVPLIVVVVALVFGLREKTKTAEFVSPQPPAVVEKIGIQEWQIEKIKEKARAVGLSEKEISLGLSRLDPKSPVSEGLCEYSRSRLLNMALIEGADLQNLREIAEIYSMICE